MYSGGGVVRLWLAPYSGVCGNFPRTQSLAPTQECSDPLGNNVPLPQGADKWAQEDPEDTSVPARASPRSGSLAILLRPEPALREHPTGGPGKAVSPGGPTVPTPTPGQSGISQVSA